MWRSPIFEKKFFWANLGQKLPKNRVFWTLCKIPSLVFSDFWQKDRVQGTLKYGRKIFPGKFFFVVNYGFSFFGEISFYHFATPLIIVAKKLFLIFFSCFDDYLFIFFSPYKFYFISFSISILYLSLGRSIMHCACFHTNLNHNSHNSQQRFYLLNTIPIPKIKLFKMQNKQAHCILDLPNDKYRMEIEKEVK